MEQSDRKAAINKREHLCQNRHVQTKTETLPFNKEWLFTVACPDPVAPIATFSLFSDASFFWSSPADSSFPAFHPLHVVYLLSGSLLSLRLCLSNDRRDSSGKRGPVLFRRFPAACSARFSPHTLHTLSKKAPSPKNSGKGRQPFIVFIRQSQTLINNSPENHIPNYRTG